MLYQLSYGRLVPSGGARTRDLRVPGENRRAPARSKYARLDSNQRPLPSHGSAPPLSYGRMSCVSVVGAALPPFDPGSVSYVEGCWSPESAASGGAFLSWEGPRWLLWMLVR